MQNDTCNRSTWGYNVELPNSRLEERVGGERETDRQTDRDRDKDRERETESVYRKNDSQTDL